MQAARGCNGSIFYHEAVARTFTREDKKMEEVKAMGPLGLVLTSIGLAVSPGLAGLLGAR